MEKSGLAILSKNLTPEESITALKEATFIFYLISGLFVGFTFLTPVFLLPAFLIAIFTAIFHLSRSRLSIIPLMLIGISLTLFCLNMIYQMSFTVRKINPWLEIVCTLPCAILLTITAWKANRMLGNYKKSSLGIRVGLFSPITSLSEAEQMIRMVCIGFYIISFLEISISGASGPKAEWVNHLNFIAFFLAVSIHIYKSATAGLLLFIWSLFGVFLSLYLLYLCISFRPNNFDELTLTVLLVLFHATLSAFIYRCFEAVKKYHQFKTPAS